MSIRNQRTGRHEDDLMDAAWKHAGWVGLKELLEHLDECVAQVPEAFGSNVTAPLDALIHDIRAFALDNPHQIDLDNAEVYVPEWDRSGRGPL